MSSSQVDLLKKLGGQNAKDYLDAQAGLASILSQPILGVIQQAPVIGSMFSTVYRLRDENIELKRRTTQLRKDLAAIKDIVGV